ncbi:putative LRR receptor-like serine/threonine-protein kinase [Capsicum annuum]|uniref:LRR receptor-like serine/threonine-protein kinase n=1 Tax=Capsicum annuum TaxID=4072 RepID=A0A2G3AC26_CAPAN|nr:inactive LRR receptor-like serine/threonine-protein kinase BIR2 [Capsicum annuum]KAF3622545.1 putative LRR receptor-like serine/threonine-protein kinase [Capsicum annuum]KAF3625286.1 putative LRR receptor-like serine/threonine-protein kinase [Capsicum annuum]PHT91809.1 putative LRR receptor-like serine/threonine-protein kinase [Capsicum annuum]
MDRFRFLRFLVLILLSVVLSRLDDAICAVVEDDLRCLEGFKNSIDDRSNNLNSWDLKNTTIGAICKFVGVACWNEKENRINGLSLPNMELGGKVTQAVEYCASLTTLDLSGNRFSGSIPSEICTWLPFLTTLDLSNNAYSGAIPADLAKCSFLNKLMLNDNKLTGSIPPEFSSLGRLKIFSVANNQLSGRIPAAFDSSNFDFEGNNLCGGPLGKCGGLSKKSLAIIIAAGVFGAAASMLLAFGAWYWFFTKAGKRKRGYGIGRDDSDSWADKLRAHKLTQVMLFQKPLVKVKLADLLIATNGFSSGNVINSTRMGTTYNAVLRDGSALAIKRLNTCKLGEKQFGIEMNRLGQLRHPNLVPLLGYCVVEEEKLLVYKHLSNGTLYSFLNGNASELDWPARFRIGLGAARGLAWLHHGCHPPILHRNICSNVIFLDEDFDPRIMDFGLARLITPSDAKESSFVNGELGELGYVAPEYASTIVPSLKGDAYSFGVVLLELATGQKPLEVTAGEEGFKGNLVDWVNQLYIAGRIKDAIDQNMRGRGHDEEIVQFLKVACNSVVSRPNDRWSMYQVYEALKSMAEKQGFSEQYDEFPLLFGKEGATSIPV